MNSLAGERLTRILKFVGSAGPDGGIARLCEMCADLTRMSGASITLMSNQASIGVGSTDEVSGLLEDLQFALGEGPGLDAYRLAQLVVEPDLTNPAVTRWPAFAPPATAAGALAVLSIPVRLDSVHLGSLNLYRDRSGPFTDDQRADAVILGGVAARTVLTFQSHAPPGRLAPQLEVGADLRLGIHRAAGLIAADLGMSVGDGLCRLRAYAFSHDRPVSEVAEDVLSRRITLDNGREPRCGDHERSSW